jgi:hypothetical protein
MLNTVFCNYGYDYIEIYALCIFDIKDMYLLVGFSTLLLSAIQNKTVLEKIVFTRDAKKYLKWKYVSWRVMFINLKHFLMHKKTTRIKELDI